jgi:ankyrin repeat protein
MERPRIWLLWLLLIGLVAGIQMAYRHFMLAGALLRAVQRHQLARERELLAEGAAPNHHGPEGWQPLHFAAADGEVDSVELLLRSGAAIDGKTDDGRTPLMVALDESRLEVAAWLVRRGANVNAQDASGTTPLARASGPFLSSEEWNSQRISRILLDAGADPNLANQLDEAPLDVAYRTDGPTDKQYRAGRIEEIRLLLAHGARASEATIENIQQYADVLGKLSIAHAIAKAGPRTRPRRFEP